jgi:hypothetical protein
VIGAATAPLIAVARSAEQYRQVSGGKEDFNSDD